MSPCFCLVLPSVQEEPAVPSVQEGTSKSCKVSFTSMEHHCLLLKAVLQTISMQLGAGASLLCQGHLHANLLEFFLHWPPEVHHLPHSRICYRMTDNVNLQTGLVTPAAAPVPLAKTSECVSTLTGALLCTTRKHEVLRTCLVAVH